METLPMAPFFFLTSHKFVTMIAIPYLFVLGVVFTCDFIVLVIAICRKHDMTSPKTSLTSAQLSRSSVKESTPRKSVSKGILKLDLLGHYVSKINFQMTRTTWKVHLPKFWRTSSCPFVVFHWPPVTLFLNFVRFSPEFYSLDAIWSPRPLT